MTLVMFASAGLLVALAWMGWITYSRVMHRNRQYFHVFASFIYVLAIEILAIFALQDESLAWQLTLIVINGMGWVAFGTLIGRFRK